jgi:hypothetical protein
MPRLPAPLALGTWLAARGTLATVGVVIVGLEALGAVVFAVAVGARRATEVPTVSAILIAWVGGIMLAFGAALRAIRSDRDEGVTALAQARGVSAGAYVRGRVGGLVLLLAVALGGASLVADSAAIAAAGGDWLVLRTAAAALVYVLAFAATVGPVAMAALGARTRAGGYLTLLAVLALPELLAPWTSDLLPRGWTELTSIPAALAAVRVAVVHPMTGGARALRAAAGLAAVVALSLLVVAARAQEERA